MNKRWIIGIFVLSIISIAVFTAMTNAPAKVIKPFNLSNEFKDYWFSGNAELTRYELNKGRYGENHKGDAVLIFVTEPFLPNQQVKYDYLPTDEKPINVLKLNFEQKFYTGFYPYSVMKSVFTPINPNNGNTLKVTMTSQDWCGHVFSQINDRNDQYDIKNYSYFQKDGDQRFSLDKAFLEDEIWTTIRLRPESLPTGKFQIIPGTASSRLNNNKMKLEDAVGELIKINDTEFPNESVSVYKLSYENINRKLSIKFQTELPHKILGWEDTFKDISGEMLTTSAKIAESIQLDYWNKNSVADSTYKQLLGLK
jgi:hypothetical protein